MIYIPLTHARAGMTLAQDVMAPNGMLALIATGQVLSDRLIKRLELYDIDGLYIESSIGEDIEPASFVKPEERHKMLSDVRSIYTGFFNQPMLSSEVVGDTKDLAENLVETILDQDEFLLDVMEIKSYDNYTYSHSLNVSMLSVLIAKSLGFVRNRLTDIALCGLMHDIGKIDIPIQIINKNGPLEADEMELVRSHPELGVERMRKCFNISHEVLRGINCHHEKIDGTGYPYHYKGDSIPLFARILAVSDVYDALTSHRSYRRAWLPCEAIEYMLAAADTQFDHSLVQVFMHLVCAYPVGCIVRLSEGSLAIVAKNYSDNVLRPRVRLIENGPLGTKGTDIDLFEDSRYLGITVATTLGAAGDTTSSLPDSIFK
ncbi:MAG: HD-GYP domain-containing protein [Oscillospiraceae bacterium]